MIIREKRALTLIEVCIAFGIIAVCFHIVFSNFNISSKLVAKNEKAQIISQQKQYLTERLYSIFEKVEPLSLEIEEKKMDGKTVSFLSCVFENGIDREMVFSGMRGCEIELIDHKLILSIFSKDGQSLREEILFHDVEKVEWNLDTTCVASLTITDKENKDLSFAFILPRTKKEKVIIEEKP